MVGLCTEAKFKASFRLSGAAFAVLIIPKLIATRQIRCNVVACFMQCEVMFNIPMLNLQAEFL